MRQPQPMSRSRGPGGAAQRKAVTVPAPCGGNVGAPGSVQRKAVPAPVPVPAPCGGNVGASRSSSVQRKAVAVAVPAPCGGNVGAHGAAQRKAVATGPRAITVPAPAGGRGAAAQPKVATPATTRLPAPAAAPATGHAQARSATVQAKPSGQRSGLPAGRNAHVVQRTLIKNTGLGGLPYTIVMNKASMWGTTGYILFHTSENRNDHVRVELSMAYGVEHLEHFQSLDKCNYDSEKKKGAWPLPTDLDDVDFDSWHFTRNNPQSQATFDAKGQLQMSDGSEDFTQRAREAAKLVVRVDPIQEFFAKYGTLEDWFVKGGTL